MQTLSTPIFTSLPKLTPLAVFDILVTAFFLYQLLTIVRGRRAERVLTGIWFLVLLYLVSLWAGLELLRGLLAAVAPYTVFALIVMFQSDLRRMLAGIGRGWTAWRSRLEGRESIEEIKMAVEVLAANRMGALIVVEREIGLRTFVESGVVLDAALSRDLLLSIFQPGGAMHDGAAIVQGPRVAAAACFLPLSMNPKWMTLYGTRHRAAIGITEEADCVAIVVSEETGSVSIAAGGEMEFGVALECIGEYLAGERTKRRGAEARELGEQRVRP